MRTLRRASKRRQFLNEGEVGEVWAKNDRKTRRDATLQADLNIVVSW
jgi:hypothetical protein